ncbi:hypothetical protein LZ31DRAFT_572717 [Colletotrichum somersetense]|nr:hypothetical protein LZ31DRAFT_572717 [Colletotrichum somersetense]
MYTTCMPVLKCRTPTSGGPRVRVLLPRVSPVMGTEEIMVMGRKSKKEAKKDAAIQICSPPTVFLFIEYGVAYSYRHRRRRDWKRGEPLLAQILMNAVKAHAPQ